MKSAKEPTIYEGVDTIRQVQFLLVFCSLLPPDGKMRKALELALSLHEEPVLARISPVEDVHPFTTKTWLESIWLHGDLPAEERALVDWQNVNENMAAAMRELQDAERQIGIKLVPQKLPE
jgi:hypothetical protein